MKYLIGFISALIITNGAQTYNQLNWEKWIKNHRSTQGQPIEGFDKFMEFLSMPLFSLFMELRNND